MILKIEDRIRPEQNRCKGKVKAKLRPGQKLGLNEARVKSE